MHNTPPLFQKGSIKGLKAREMGGGEKRELTGTKKPTRAARNLKGHTCADSSLARSGTTETGMSGP